MDKLFESQVSLTPDAIAVAFEEQQWTYRELNAKANQLAHYLKKHGVAPEVPVGICAERSLDMVVGILGILKAGGAYVPLDPAYPEQRLAFILEETKVPLILTQRHLFEVLPQSQASIICLDKEWETIAQESEQTPSSETTPQNLAYVMYTSGSTGKPKGVQMPRANVQQYIQALSKVLPIQPDDVYLHVASFSFSSSVRQLMLPLSQGGKVIIATREQTKNPLSLFELIQKQGVTVSDGVSSVWRYGLQALENLDRIHTEALLKSNLRFIVLSGELTSCQLYKKLRNLFQDKVRFFNVYGQTETIGNCAYAVPEEFDAEQGYLPVGYPYPHNKAYILDEDLQPVLPGEIGELHMAGGCLARGYLNRPDLNAEKFISNPFVENITSESFDQLFKTGDLARYLPDGAIELLTRVDFQVKLRGMRVELGEIESALEQYSGIKQAVVVAREDIPGEKRLVAYAVPEFHSEEIISNVLSRELRRFLEQKLPDYMVPSAFVFLDTLPLTPNGKLDRLSLPAPIQDNSDPNRAFAAPQDDLELQLTQIWEKLLGVQSIGIKDDFFELGGNSLLAVQLVTEIQKISGTNLPLTALLEASTVEQMANILRQPIQTDWPVLVPIRSTGSKKPLFCIHAIGGPVLFYRDLVRYLDPEQPLYGLQSKGLDGKQTPLTRVEDMAALYIKEMRTVQPEGPYFIGGHSFGGLIAYEMAQQLHAQGQKVALLAFFDVITPKLAKTSPPLLRFVRTHLINFWRTETKDKLNYFMKRVKWYQLRKEVRKNEYKEHLQKQKVNAIPMLHVLDTNYQASMSYEPKTYPGKVTVFRAMEQSPRSAHDPYMGWGELATGGVESYEIPGSHLNIVEEPNVKFLAEKLSVCLNKAQANYVYLVQQ